MIARQDSLAGDDNRRWRFQFTIRGLLLLTLVVSVLLSMGPYIGSTLSVLMVVQMLTLKRLETDLVADSYGFKYPALSLAGCISVFILPLAFAASVVLVLCWVFRPMGWSG